MAYTSSSSTVAPTVEPTKKPYSIIIPAAGLGSRMKSHGPKALTKIKGNVTIIDNQLKHIHRYLRGSQVIVVAGFEYEKVRNKFRGTPVEVVYNPNFNETNVVGSIAVGLNHAKYKDVLVVYGDLVFNAYTLKAPFGSYSLVITGGMNDKEVGCVIEHNRVEHMMFDLPNKWAQIAYFHGRELELLHQVVEQEKYWGYFGFEIINIIINSGGTFAATSPQRMKIIDIDSAKDLLQVENIL